MSHNPVRGVKRPKAEGNEGKTPALGDGQARALLEAPLAGTLKGKRDLFTAHAKPGSAAAWGHLNLLGEYDFSEDKLQDSVGIKPPKLTD